MAKKMWGTEEAAQRLQALWADNGCTAMPELKDGMVVCGTCQAPYIRMGKALFHANTPALFAKKEEK